MPMGRHRHAVNVRSDGLATVLGQLMQDKAIRAALLVDVDSGMILDACGPQACGIGVDQEQLGAAHGDLMRLALGPAVAAGASGQPDQHRDCEIVVSRDDGQHLVLRLLPDPYGDRLALSVLIDGPGRALRRTRRQLREVSASALTAGPTTSLRPVEGTWVPGVIEERAVPVTRPKDVPSRAYVTPVLGIEPVRGPALAALDAAVAPRPRASPALDALGDERAFPVVASPDGIYPDTEERRPAPPSALPPPAQRNRSVD
jgi:hypothetical protein